MLPSLEESTEALLNSSVWSWSSARDCANFSSSLAFKLSTCQYVGNLSSYAHRYIRRILIVFAYEINPLVQIKFHIYAVKSKTSRQHEPFETVITKEDSPHLFIDNIYSKISIHQMFPLQKSCEKGSTNRKIQLLKKHCSLSSCLYGFRIWE